MSKATTARPRNRKAQLAAVAAELFRTHGYHEVGISDIAAAAGVTGPAIYRHFTDKQDMLAHVVLSGVDELAEATNRAIGADPHPSAEQVEDMLASMAKLSVERRELTALWRTQRRHMRESDRATTRRRSQELLDNWSRGLRAVRPELPEADAELLCWAALSTFGSASMHSTRIAKRRFESVLAERARAVLHCTLPESPPALPGAQAREAAAEATETQVLRTSRREQLITEAGRLFQERGFHEVSMDDIGAAAGISGPSVYRHFPSKAALFLAVSQRVTDRLERGRQRVSETATDETAALRGLISSYVEIMFTHADLLAVGQQMSALSEGERAELRRVQRDYVSEWVRLLCALQPERDTQEGRIIVHIALTIANDLLRTRRITARPGIRAELEALMATALGLPAR